MNRFIKAGLVAGVAGLLLAPVAQAVEGEIVISDVDYGNWISVQEAGGVQAHGIGAPVGFGENSLRLKTTSENDSRVMYIYPEMLSLTDLNQLKYSTKQVVASNPGGSAAMFVAVDLDGDFIWDTNLIYEPYLQNGGNSDAAPVVANTWQAWDVTAGGLFWSSQSYGSLTAGVNGGLFTLDDIRADYPLAQTTALGFSVGYDNPNYNIGIDGVYINGQAFNFEGSNAEEDVTPTPEEPEYAVPTHKDQCKNYGWLTFVGPDGQMFRNQGQCVSFLMSKKNSKL